MSKPQVVYIQGKKFKRTTYLAPEKFCRGCRAYQTKDAPGLHSRISASPGCPTCRGTGDHYFGVRGKMTLASYGRLRLIDTGD